MTRVQTALPRKQKGNWQAIARIRPDQERLNENAPGAEGSLCIPFNALPGRSVAADSNDHTTSNEIAVAMRRFITGIHSVTLTRVTKSTRSGTTALPLRALSPARQ